MPQSLAQVHLHIVFSTRDRKPFLTNPDLRNQMHRYLHGICTGLNCPAIRINGPENHVHILCRLNRNRAIAELLRELKRSSTKWMQAKDSGLPTFLWQRGYGCFAVGMRDVANVITYIDGQLDHHARYSFKEEFRCLCREFQVELDDQYAWD